MWPYHKELSRKLYVEDHPKVGSCYYNLVNDHWNLGENEEAKKCDEKALMIRKKTHSEEHPDVARSYGNLGSDYTALQRYDETEECFEKTLMV